MLKKITKEMEDAGLRCYLRIVLTRLGIIISLLGLIGLFFGIHVLLHDYSFVGLICFSTLLSVPLYFIFTKFRRLLLKSDQTNAAVPLVWWMKLIHIISNIVAVLITGIRIVVVLSIGHYLLPVLCGSIFRFWLFLYIFFLCFETAVCVIQCGLFIKLISVFIKQ